MPSRLLLRLLAVLMVFIVTGCTSMFFQPDRIRYSFVERQGLRFHENVLASLDGTLLSTWYFPALENIKAMPDFAADFNLLRPKGLIVQFHGNAENMSSHYQSLAWAPLAGYDLLTFDYRGYGSSRGVKGMQGIYEDTVAMIRQAELLARAQDIPLILVGQSIGGTLLLRALQDEEPLSLKLVLIEGAFHDYREIAQEKLAGTWLTWPLQWLAWPLISNKYSPTPQGLAKMVRGVPVILLYSEHDAVVPINHGEEIYQELREPKEFWRHPYPGHLNGLAVERGFYRKRLLQQIEPKLSASTRTPRGQPSSMGDQNPHDVEVSQVMKHLIETKSVPVSGF